MSSGRDLGVGLGAAAVAIVFFGSQGVPIKRARTGDGFFFQFILCVGIWLVGFVVQCIYQTPFEMFAMLGGFFWCTGNILTIPIVKTIGFSYGMLIYSTTNFLMGWSSGKFGLFGLKKDEVADPTLNTVGALLSLLRILILAFMDSKCQRKADKSSGNTEISEKEDSRCTVFDAEDGKENGEGLPLLGDRLSSPVTKPKRNAFVDRKEKAVGLERLHYGVQKALGIAMALIAGFLYGVNFDPAEYLKDNPSAFLPPNSTFSHSSESTAYVFSHYTGIILTSSVYFFGYSFFKSARKEEPIIYGDSVIYGLFAGLMWGIAQFGWFMANQNLEFVESFPLVTSGPSLVASLWGIFLFKEIRGRKNYLLTAAAFAVVAISDILVILSRQ